MTIIFWIAVIFYLLADGMIAAGGILDVLGGVWPGLLTAIFGATSMILLLYLLRSPSQRIAIMRIVAGLNLGFSASDAHTALITQMEPGWESLNSAAPSLMLFALSLMIFSLYMRVRTNELI